MITISLILTCVRVIPIYFIDLSAITRSMTLCLAFNATFRRVTKCRTLIENDDTRMCLYCIHACSVFIAKNGHDNLTNNQWALFLTYDTILMSNLSIFYLGGRLTTLRTMRHCDEFYFWAIFSGGTKLTTIRNARPHCRAGGGEFFIKPRVYRISG